jgi:rod shape-determining protein MreD
VSLAVGLAAVAFAALAQMAVLPEFSIFGVQPNLVIALLAAWIGVRGQREAFLLIPAAGLALGLLDSQPLGLAMLAFAPLILLTEVRELRLVESNLLPALMMAALATLSYETAVLLRLALGGEQLDWLASVWDVLLPAAFANALLLLPVYGVVRLASVQPRRPRALA